MLIVGPDKGKILADAIRIANPKHFLEIGTLIGYSAILMGRGLEAEAEITSVEIHADEANAAEENIRRSQILRKKT